MEWLARLLQQWAAYFRKLLADASSVGDAVESPGTDETTAEYADSELIRTEVPHSFGSGVTRKLQGTGQPPAHWIADANRINASMAIEPFASETEVISRDIRASALEKTDSEGSNDRQNVPAENANSATQLRRPINKIIEEIPEHPGNSDATFNRPQSADILAQHRAVPIGAQSEDASLDSVDAKSRPPVADHDQQLTNDADYFQLMRRQRTIRLMPSSANRLESFETSLPSSAPHVAAPETSTDSSAVQPTVTSPSSESSVARQSSLNADRRGVRPLPPATDRVTEFDYPSPHTPLLFDLTNNHATPAKVKPTADSRRSEESAADREPSVINNTISSGGATVSQDSSKNEGSGIDLLPISMKSVRPETRPKEQAQQQPDAYRSIRPTWPPLPTFEAELTEVSERKEIVTPVKSPWPRLERSHNRDPHPEPGKQRVLRRVAARIRRLEQEQRGE